MGYNLLLLFILMLTFSQIQAGAYVLWTCSHCSLGASLPNMAQ